VKILREEAAPMGPKEIHARLAAEHGFEAVSYPTVKNALSDATRASRPRVRRIGYGKYVAIVTT
jgi:hypothetical protein